MHLISPKYDSTGSKSFKNYFRMTDKGYSHVNSRYDMRYGFMVTLQGIRAATEMRFPSIQTFRCCVITHKSLNIRFVLFGFLPPAFPNRTNFEIVNITQNFQLIIGLSS